MHLIVGMFGELPIKSGQLKKFGKWADSVMRIVLCLLQVYFRNHE